MVKIAKKKRKKIKVIEKVETNDYWYIFCHLIGMNLLLLLFSGFFAFIVADLTRITQEIEKMNPWLFFGVFLGLFALSNTITWAFMEAETKTEEVVKELEVENV